jgi:hypothetical protein
MSFGLSVVLALSACAAAQSTQVKTTASPWTNFQDFKIYAFVPADRLDMKGSQMADPVTRRNLEAAIGRELQAKGLSPAANNTQPDLLVSYFADVYEGEDKNRPIGGPGGEVNWQRQGVLTIDIINTADQQIVWHGEAWARDPNFRTTDWIITELLHKYPKAQ